MKKKKFIKHKCFSQSLLFSGGQDSSMLIFLYLIKKTHEESLFLTISHESQVDSFFLFSHSFFFTVFFQNSFSFNFLNFNKNSFFFKKTEKNLRRKRYQISVRNNIFYKTFDIATAHTKTDFLETLLLNVLRGTGVKGLSLDFKHLLLISKDYHRFLIFLNFINSLILFKTTYKFKRKKNYHISINLLKKKKVIRPLILNSRITFLRMSKKIRLALFIDRTNSVLEIKRNRIRRHLIFYIQFFFNSNFENLFFHSSKIFAQEIYFSYYLFFLFETFSFINILNKIIIIDTVLLMSFPQVVSKKLLVKKQIKINSDLFFYIREKNILGLIYCLKTKKILLLKTNIYLIFYK
uniref:Hypothetical chloroplast RF62 n=1 Tax=Pedinomonas tuberculata TaxID=160064 RepID=A0A097KL81_9CHLO|nr:hypothetical chloroplast RF62 [Pedinomonas tuberculata]AIT93949.1 hypothetical chloroplast RF62 [Pedinomonas tuberculata]